MRLRRKMMTSNNPGPGPGVIEALLRRRRVLALMNDLDEWINTKEDEGNQISWIIEAIRITANLTCNDDTL
jgi:hypothetical protein